MIKKQSMNITLIEKDDRPNVETKKFTENSGSRIISGHIVQKEIPITKNLCQFFLKTDEITDSLLDKIKEDIFEIPK